MVQDASASLAPNRRGSLLAISGPMTSGNTLPSAHSSVTTDSTPLRYHRLSYHPPPTYPNNEWDVFKHSRGMGSVFVNEDVPHADPFSHLSPTTVSDVSTPRRPHGHARRPSSLAESIKNGFSSVRSLGRRMSLSMKSKSQTASDCRTDSVEPRSMTAQPFSWTEPLEGPSESRTGIMQHLRPRRRPSMPILKFKPEQRKPLPVLRRPEYHRATTLPQAPEYPAGGAGARASAAAQNEALFNARATPLPAYRPRSPDSLEELRDSESGIDITLDGISLQRSNSQTPHLVKCDPADMLAPELLEHMLAFLNADALLRLQMVSKRWHSLCQSQPVWRQVFYREYAPSRPSNRVLGAPKVPGLGKNSPGQDYRKLYAVRRQIDNRWANGEAAAIYLSGHKDSVYCIQFDEDKIITGSRDNTVRVWDARTYQCIRKLSPPNNQRERNTILRADVEPAGIVPFFKMDAHSFDVKSKPQAMWHHASVLCLQYDDEILVTGSSDFSCIVWDIKKDYQPRLRLTGHRAGVLDVCIDKRRIATCSKDTTIKIWDRNTGALLKTLQGHRGPVNAVQLRGNLLASASGDGMAKLWRLDNWTCIKEFHSRERGLACVEFSEDGRSIFAGGNDHVIYEYDTQSGLLKRELSGHDDLVRSLHLDGANGRLISGSYDHSVRVWDSKSGTTSLDGGLKINLEGWTSSWMLAAKSNYRKIACASQDGRVVIVDFGFGINGVELVEA